MRTAFVALLLALLTASSAFAEVTAHWWGVVSFRQRHETTKEYTDFADSSRRGTPLSTTDNSTTRLGYQFGVKLDLRDNLKAGITFRSGLTSGALVMQQEITSRDGLQPGLQEAYIDWQTPFLRAELGKIPQAGTAMWDVYASSLQTDFRADDPRDGTFNDRIAALNGARITRMVGPVTLRGIFHSDYVSGFYRTNEYVDATRKFDRVPDRNVVILGTTIDLGSAFGCKCSNDSCAGCGKGESKSFLGGLKALATNGVTLDFDYGFPKRATKSGTNPDSLSADENLWGATLKKSVGLGTLQAGYGYNWRDSSFTIKYWDILAQANAGNISRCFGSDLGDLTLSVRYQHATEEMHFDPYKGATAIRDAIHVYLNDTIWGLDIQPRVIFFTKKTSGFKQQSQTRYEVTTTVKF
jgi:hypothetical protein